MLITNQMTQLEYTKDTLDNHSLNTEQRTTVINSNSNSNSNSSSNPSQSTIVNVTPQTVVNVNSDQNKIIQKKSLYSKIGNVCFWATLTVNIATGAASQDIYSCPSVYVMGCLAKAYFLGKYLWPAIPFLIIGSPQHYFCLLGSISGNKQY